MNLRHRVFSACLFSADRFDLTGNICLQRLKHLLIIRQFVAQFAFHFTDSGGKVVDV